MDDESSSVVAQGPASASVRSLWMAELRAIGALAIPVVIQTSAQQGMTVTDQVFLGHLGTAELAAAALANSYTNLMWFFLLGFATALDTLGSHAYGAGDRRALTTWCIAVALLLTVLVGPLAVGMALGGAVGRTLFAQDDRTATLMGRFCNGLIPGMWPLMWGVVLTKYLQVQNHMLLPSLIAVATFLLNIGFNAALVRTIGFQGAPIATSLSRCAQFLMLAAAVWRHEWRQRRHREQYGKDSSDGDGEGGSGSDSEGFTDELPVGPPGGGGATAAGKPGGADVATAASLPYGRTDDEVLLLLVDMAQAWPVSEPDENIGPVAGAAGRAAAASGCGGGAVGGAVGGGGGGGGGGTPHGMVSFREGAAEPAALRWLEPRQSIQLARSGPFAISDGAEEEAGTRWGKEAGRGEGVPLLLGKAGTAVRGDASTVGSQRLSCEVPYGGLAANGASGGLGCAAAAAADDDADADADDNETPLRRSTDSRGSGPRLGGSCMDEGGRGSGGCGESDPGRGWWPIGEPAPEAWWRGVYEQCRTAMHPRVVSRVLRLGIPGGLSMAFEAGCFDFSTVLAGRLGPIATAAHAAMLSVVTFTYLACPFALATAGSIRVGNLLGAGQPEGARRAGVLAVSLSGGFMALAAVLLLACHRVLGYMFTSDPRVVDVIQQLAIFAALFQVSDGVMGSSQGVLRGCGHQHMTAVFNFTGFWLCGVLLGYLLCFKAGFGINGLWAGITSGDTATGVLNLVALSRIRWGREADKAVARLKALAEHAEEEQAMLSAKQTTSSSVHILAADGGGGNVPPVVGGGRTYAGGLKRVWSEKRVGQEVAAARRRRQQQHQQGAWLRQDSATGRLIRSLSSFFRRQQQQQEQLDGDTGGEQRGGADGNEAGIRHRRQVELLP